MSPSEDSGSSSAPTRISVHRALGGGAVAGVLLWRRLPVSVAAVVLASAAWYLFERAGYGFLSLFSNALLLLVVILFFWAKSASLLNRPLPPLPNLEVSDQVVEKVADEARAWINAGLTVAHDIAIGSDKKLFLKVVLILWFVSYVGSFFNFLTLLYIVFLLSITVPVLYEKYQEPVDEKLVLVHGIFSKHYESILEKTGKSARKERKTE